MRNVSARSLIPHWTRIVASPRRKQGPFPRIVLQATRENDRECDPYKRRKSRLPKRLPKASPMRNARDNKDIPKANCIVIWRKSLGISQSLPSPKARSRTSTAPNQTYKPSTNDLFIVPQAVISGYFTLCIHLSLGLGIAEWKLGECLSLQPILGRPLGALIHQVPRIGVS